MDKINGSQTVRQRGRGDDGQVDRYEIQGDKKEHMRSMQAVTVQINTQTGFGSSRVGAPAKERSKYSKHEWVSKWFKDYTGSERIKVQRFLYVVYRYLCLANIVFVNDKLTRFVYLFIAITVRVCSNGAFLTKIKVCPISAVLKLLQNINRRNSFEFFKKHRFPTSAVTSKVTNKGQK